MPWHSIEIDDEVFAYLQARAKPLVDTANTVLRRELLDREAPAPTPSEVSMNRSSADGVLPSLPLGIPEALRQTLEVVFLARTSRRTRPEATHFVAREHGVAPQTVLDKYCRQLNLTANQFDALLRQADLHELNRVLASKFPQHAAEIRDLLRSWGPRAA